jgi:hypothetical protein
MTIPAHISPTYSEDLCEDTLFHYTTASGLLGILRKNEIWSTAHHCVNDESELQAGKGVLTALFRKKDFELRDAQDLRLQTFASRGVPFFEYSNKFEGNMLSHALSFFFVFITCLCKPNGKEDFLHGLLSQWRGYGAGSGYAIQFNRSKLRALVEKAQQGGYWGYDLQDVKYCPDNELKDEVLKHSDAYISSYLAHLDRLAQPDFGGQSVPSPWKGLGDGPLVRLLDYFINTKSPHFSEERECRLSVIEARTSDFAKLEVDYFDRNGLIVPYVKSPETLDIVGCIEWIIVGPDPRLESRLHSVAGLVKSLGLDIQIGPSHIPFSTI